MKSVSIFVTILLLSLFLGCSQKSDTTPHQVQEVSETPTSTYYLIRHAEKDRSDKSNKNPDLTETGNQRAVKWAGIFSNIAFDAIYSTNYNRTQQTAEPTALKQNLTIRDYDPSNLYSEAFKNQTQGKTVLIVGHSNTTPQFVNAILGKNLSADGQGRQVKYENIDDNNNGNLYIVTVSGSIKKVSLLTIN